MGFRVKITAKADRDLDEILGWLLAERDGYAAARAGRLPERLWTELYLQGNAMSIFSQYVPYKFADGKTWDHHREAARNLPLDVVGRFCSSFPDAVIDSMAMGPPDIERNVGLTGRHIFQGECLPICGATG